MMRSRLQQQFIRLWQYYQGQVASTTLQKLADILYCSRRHVRSLLNTMQQQGWLSWQAESGRGKHSLLTFHVSALTMQQKRAEILLEQDKIDQLVNLVGDKNALRNMLFSQLGRSFRQGKHILRIPYYRPFTHLLPGTALRRSEMHLVRQIFNALTTINEENGEVESDIAHYWHRLSPLHWRFYIRPAIRFHHGRELEMSDIIESLTRLTIQPLFNNLKTISSPAANVIDVYLHSPDSWLPWLLGHLQATILPREWPKLLDYPRLPIGTGPYKVVCNNDNQLKIQAFDDYFGYRALIDEVNIWVLPDIGEETIYDGVKLQGTQSTDHNELENRLEEGCYFLLFDQQSDKLNDINIRHWLCELLNPYTLLKQAGAIYQRYFSPAHGLLPRWHHQPQASMQQKAQNLHSLTLTYYCQHPEFPAIADIITALLAQHGVTLKLQQVDYSSWHNKEVASDLWLGSVSFYQPLEFSFMATLLEMPLIQKCLSAELQQDITAQWRAKKLDIAELDHLLIHQRLLHPLFHHWLQLHGQESMRGLHMNAIGWFDFKKVWFTLPDI